MLFSSYAMGSVRVSSLSKFGVIYIMTHDSIGLGEDGPTHQPIEMLECLRATPNLLVFRPCDGNETIGSYRMAIERVHTPSVLSLSRQVCPTLQYTCSGSVMYGAYILQDIITESLPISLILVSSGTELSLTLDVAKNLSANHKVSVRVVSMPCWELFDEQTLEYQLSVFPVGFPVMSIEASGIHGWSKYSHVAFGMVGFGLSAPLKDLYSHFGFTLPNLVAKSLEVIEFYKTHGPAASLLNAPKICSSGSH